MKLTLPPYMIKKIEVLGLETIITLRSGGAVGGVDQIFMHFLIWQIFIKHLLYLSHLSRHCKDSSEQKRRPCSHGIPILVELENTQVHEQVQWRKTRQGARDSRCWGRILLLCGERSGKASPKSESPGEEGWPRGCLGKEHTTPRESEMGTVSVFEEQPGGQCAGREWASRDLSQGTSGPPRPLQGLWLFLWMRWEPLEEFEWKEGHDLT